MEEKRRKLESRLDDFHNKGSQFIDENEDDDFEMLPQATGWEKEDDEVSDDDSSYDDDGDGEAFEDEEDEEVVEPVENASIGLPSSYDIKDMKALGLEELAKWELAL